jgi:hypothetical protein
MRKVVQQLDLQQEYYAAGMLGNMERDLVLYTADHELSIHSGKNTESRIMDAGNLLLVSENLHRLSKKERANANAYDINEFLEPYVPSSPGLCHRRYRQRADLALYVRLADSDRNSVLIYQQSRKRVRTTCEVYARMGNSEIGRGSDGWLRNG